jgi:hypothetical protein
MSSESVAKVNPHALKEQWLTRNTAMEAALLALARNVDKRLDGYFRIAEPHAYACFHGNQTGAKYWKSEA